MNSAAESRTRHLEPLLCNGKDEPPTPSFKHPFKHFYSLSSLQTLQVVLMTIFVVPIRFFLIGSLLILSYLIACVVLLADRYQPKFGWKRKGRPIVARLMYSAHIVAGFKVTIKGERALPWEAPLLVAAPHCSHFDTLPFVALAAPSVVGKAQLMDTPLIGKMLLLTEPIFVDRDCKDSRKMTLDKIKERAQHIAEDRDATALNRHHWPQVMIFPEGTCTNRSQLITFKPGAFYPQLPVQPVILRWPERQPDMVAYSWEGVGVSTQVS